MTDKLTLSMDINEVSEKIATNILRTANKLVKLAGYDDPIETIKLFNMIVDRTFFYRNDELCRIEGAITPNGKVAIKYIRLHHIPERTIIFFLRGGDLNATEVSEAIVSKCITNLMCIRNKMKHMDIALKRNRISLDPEKISRMFLTDVIL